jgi:hypothetical protein
VVGFSHTITYAGIAFAVTAVDMCPNNVKYATLQKRWLVFLWEMSHSCLGRVTKHTFLKLINHFTN